MDRWVPLFQIFLNSPTPEGDASLWLHQHHRSPSDFLSLLESPTPSPPLLYIQTLPSTTQSRILSFLATDSHRFCPRRLHSLATRILSPSAQDRSFFWARRAAHHLLDSIPSSPKENEYDQQQPQEKEFDALPDWLQADAALIPQLHLRPSRIPTRAPPAMQMQPEPMEEEEEASSSPILPLNSQDCSRASTLRIELLSSNSTSQALHLSREIAHLGSGAANQLQLLSLIEPWQCDDETISLLLSNLVPGSWSDDWPAHVLCSTVLPKLLLLQEPASRTLLSAVISFCKLHQREAVGALVLPLLLRKGGIGVHLCDVLARIVKECLHPAHVSAFCQRLLCCEGESVGLVCQPCHRELIANKVEWTEPLFTLFQHMLNHGVQLTPDTVDRLVLVVDEMAGKFSKSLKFGNFLLCFVSKCFQASCFHKTSLVRVTQRTDSFVTKSVLAKLAEY